MNRNRLVSTSSQENLFATAVGHIHQYRAIIITFLFVISGIFITSIVLATNAPNEDKEVVNIASSDEQASETLMPACFKRR